MKIAYLEAGLTLDYWVAMAAGYDPVYQPESVEGPRVCIAKCHNDQGELVPVALRAFRPSTSWGDGGPFIEREHIDLVSDFGRWMGRHGKRQDYSRADGAALVAAMRAYLAWEYGDKLQNQASTPPVQRRAPSHRRSHRRLQGRRDRRQTHATESTKVRASR